MLVAAVPLAGEWRRLLLSPNQFLFQGGQCHVHSVDVVQLCRVVLGRLGLRSGVGSGGFGWALLLLCRGVVQSTPVGAPALM